MCKLIVHAAGLAALVMVMASVPLRAENTPNRDIPAAAGNEIYETEGVDRDRRADGHGHEEPDTGRDDELAGERRNAHDIVQDATRTVEKMKHKEGMIDLLKKAKGVYIVPDYGRGALIAGVRGGQGIMLANVDGEWSHPAFYNMGAISIGAQAGGEAGEVAFLLMTDSAIEAFRQDNNFAFNAEAGLTIINWSAQAQASYGKGDVILWTDTEGAFLGGSVSVSDIMADNEANRAYYSPTANATNILDNKVVNPPENVLAKVLP